MCVLFPLEWCLFWIRTFSKQTLNLSVWKTSRTQSWGRARLEHALLKFYNCVGYFQRSRWKFKSEPHEYHSTANLVWCIKLTTTDMEATGYRWNRLHINQIDQALVPVNTYTSVFYLTLVFRSAKSNAIQPTTKAINIMEDFHKMNKSICSPTCQHMVNFKRIPDGCAEWLINIGMHSYALLRNYTCIWEAPAYIYLIELYIL